MQSLSARDLQMLKCVKQGASIREMAQAIGVRSSNTAHKRLKRLISEGYVTVPPHKKMARSWRLTDEGEIAIAPYVPKIA